MCSSRKYPHPIPTEGIGNSWWGEDGEDQSPKNFEEVYEVILFPEGWGGGG